MKTARRYPGIVQRDLRERARDTQLRTMTNRKSHAIHVASFLLVRRTGARDNDDGANEKSDRCRHNAPAHTPPGDLCAAKRCVSSAMSSRRARRAVGAEGAKDERIRRIDNSVDGTVAPRALLLKAEMFAKIYRPTRSIISLCRCEKLTSEYSAKRETPEKIRIDYRGA